MNGKTQEEPQEPKKNVFCFLCPGSLIKIDDPNLRRRSPVSCRLSAMKAYLSNPVEYYRQSAMKAYASKPAEYFRLFRLYLGFLVVGFFLAAIPGVFIAYHMVSSYGYKTSSGFTVPPLSPEQDLFLKTALGMMFSGYFLYMTSAIHCYRRISKSFQTQCGRIKKMCLILSILLLIFGTMVFISLASRQPV